MFSLILTVVTLGGDPITTTSYHPSWHQCADAGEALSATAAHFQSLEYDCVVVTAGPDGESPSGRVSL